MLNLPQAGDQACTYVEGDSCHLVEFGSLNGSRFGNSSCVRRRTGSAGTSTNIASKSACSRREIWRACFPMRDSERAIPASYQVAYRSATERQELTTGETDLIAERPNRLLKYRHPDNVDEFQTQDSNLEFGRHRIFVQELQRFSKIALGIVGEVLH